MLVAAALDGERGVALEGADERAAVVGIDVSAGREIRMLPLDGGGVLVHRLLRSRDSTPSAAVLASPSAHMALAMLRMGNAPRGRIWRTLARLDLGIYWKIKVNRGRSAPEKEAARTVHRPDRGRSFCRKPDRSINLS